MTLAIRCDLTSTKCSVSRLLAWPREERRSAIESDESSCRWTGPQCRQKATTEGGEPGSRSGEGEGALAVLEKPGPATPYVWRAFSAHTPAQTFKTLAGSRFRARRD